MQPTLGGLPPLLIMVGGGEILRDEQIYLAHKCANPAKYAPNADTLDERTRAAIARYKPTDVQLQVWDDLCHVAPTLSFTRPAKYMFRSIAQFGAWALARAQQTGIEIVDDDQISVISTSASDSDSVRGSGIRRSRKGKPGANWVQVGRAGDPLPPFKGHMIRQSVARRGDVFPLAAVSELPGCTMAVESVGVPKKVPVGRWLQAKQLWDSRYAGDIAKVHKRRLRDAAVGFESFGLGECPPPSALAGRRRIGADMTEKKPAKRSYGLALWSMWGSKHDESAVARQLEADDAPETKTATRADGQGSRPFGDIQQKVKAAASRDMGRKPSRRRVVRDERQAEEPQDGSSPVAENTPLAQLLALRKAESEKSGGGGCGGCGRGLAMLSSAATGHDGAAGDGMLAPGCDAATGVAGKRPFLGGIALPFSLNKDAETASMVTLDSADPVPSMSGSTRNSWLSGHAAPLPLVVEDEEEDEEEEGDEEEDAEEAGDITPRPSLETFVTANDIPRVAVETA